MIGEPLREFICSAVNINDDVNFAMPIQARFVIIIIINLFLLFFLTVLKIRFSTLGRPNKKALEP